MLSLVKSSESRRSSDERNNIARKQYTATMDVWKWKLGSPCAFLSLCYYRPRAGHRPPNLQAPQTRATTEGREVMI